MNNNEGNSNININQNEQNTSKKRFNFKLLVAIIVLLLIFIMIVTLLVIKQVKPKDDISNIEKGNTSNTNIKTTTNKDINYVYNTCVLSQSSAVGNSKYAFSTLLKTDMNEDSREGKEFYAITIAFHTNDISNFSNSKLYFKNTDKEVKSERGKITINEFFGKYVTSDANVGDISEEDKTNLFYSTVYTIYSNYKINPEDLYLKYETTDGNKQNFDISKDITAETNPVGIYGNAVATINGKYYLFNLGNGLGGGSHDGQYRDYRLAYIYNISDPFSEKFDYSGYSLDFYNPQTKQYGAIRSSLSPFLEYEEDKNQLKIGVIGKKADFDYSPEEWQDWIGTVVPFLTDSNGNRLYFCND